MLTEHIHNHMTNPEHLRHRRPKSEVKIQLVIFVAFFFPSILFFIGT